jgi:hypothetical protein
MVTKGSKKHFQSTSCTKLSQDSSDGYGRNNRPSVKNLKQSSNNGSNSSQFDKTFQSSKRNCSDSRKPAKAKSNHSKAYAGRGSPTSDLTSEISKESSPTYTSDVSSNDSASSNAQCTKKSRTSRKKSKAYKTSRRRYECELSDDNQSFEVVVLKKSDLRQEKQRVSTSVGQKSFHKTRESVPGLIPINRTVSKSPVKEPESTNLKSILLNSFRAQHPTAASPARISHDLAVRNSTLSYGPSHTASLNNLNTSYGPHGQSLEVQQLINYVTQNNKKVQLPTKGHYAGPSFSNSSPDANSLPLPVFSNQPSSSPVYPVMSNSSPSQPLAARNLSTIFNTLKSSRSYASDSRLLALDSAIISTGSSTVGPLSSENAMSNIQSVYA